MSSARSGTTLNASPACRTVGTAVRWSGPAGAWTPATACAAAAAASRALTPLSGAEPECDERPSATTLTVPAALRRTTTASSPEAGSSWPASKHRHASQPAKRSTWPKRPSRHSSSLTSSSAASPRSPVAGGERPQDPEGEDVPALHVDRPGAVQAVALAPQGLVALVSDDGVEVPEQEDARAARASTREAQEQVGRVPRRRAGHALDARPVRRQRRRDRGGLLRAAHVARRRRDADEGLELAREAGLDRGGVLGDPGVHGSRRVPAMAGPKVGDVAPDFALEGTQGPFRLADHRGHRVVLLFYPGDRTAVCTKQFCSYRDRADDMADLDAVVVGISDQDVASHASFTADHGLTVPLLADVDKRVARSVRGRRPGRRHAPRRLRPRRGRRRPPPQGPRARAGLRGRRRPARGARRAVSGRAGTRHRPPTSSGALPL